MQHLNSAAIKAEKVLKRYGDLIAVNEITFEVPHGICFGFLGPNGAGKTTLMRLIYGRSPLTAGELRVLGRNIMHEARQVKGELGVVTQEDSLDYDLDVKQNLIVYSRYYHLSRSMVENRIEQLLDFFQLKDRVREPVRNLSGGYKRRLQIARALVNDPRLLILDEPTTGLDPQARHHVWGRLRKLRRKGITLLLTTHYMDEAEHLCDELIIMDRGVIVAQGTPRDLIAKYVSPEVVEVQKGDYELRIPEQYPELVLRRENLGDRWLLYTSDAEELFKRLTRSGWPIAGLLVRRSSLEDVFLVLTGRELRE